MIVCVGGPLTDAMRAFFRALGPTVAVRRGRRGRGRPRALDGKPLPGRARPTCATGDWSPRAPWSGRVVDGAVSELLAREDFEIIGRPGDVAGDAVLPALEAQLRDSPYFTEAALVPGEGGLVAHVGARRRRRRRVGRGARRARADAARARRRRRPSRSSRARRSSGWPAAWPARSSCCRGGYAGRGGADAAAGRAPRGTAGVIGPQDEHPHPVAPQAFQTWKENWCLCAVDPAAALRGRLPRVAAARARRGDLLGQAVRGGA